MAKVLGIEIGSTMIRICETDYKAKNPRVYKTVFVKTPKGAVRDDVVLVDGELVETIKKAIHAAGMRAKQVVFTINSAKIANREVSIPYVKAGKVADVVKINASDYFPVDLEQYELGHSIIGTMENEKGVKQYRVLVLAAPKTIVESYFSLAEALGCTVAALDYSGNSIYQAVRSQLGTGVQMLIRIDETSTLVTVIKNQITALQRTVSYGVNDLVEAVMDSPEYEAPSYEDAVGILYAEDGLLEETDATLGMEASDSLNYLINGIARVVDYYNSRNGETPVENIYLTGLGGGFTGLDDLIENAVGIHTIPLQEVDILHLPKDFKPQQLGICLTCIGAAIAPIGFLGDHANDNKKMEIVPDKKGMKSMALLICAGGILISAVLSVTSMMELEAEQDTNRRLQARIKELEPIKEVYAAYLQQQYSWTKLQYLYNSTVTPNEALVAFIEEMEEKMPSSLNVQSFSAGPEGVSMSLTVRDKKEAAKLISQFKTFDTLSSVAVSGISDSGAVMEGEPLEEEGRVSFSITLTYKGEDEAAAGQTGTQ